MARKFIKSGLSNRFRVEMLDTELVDVETIAGDAMQWERVHKMPFQDNVSASSLLWTAWRALRRLGRTDEATFAAWADRVRDFAVEQEEDDEDEPNEDPTQPAQ